MKHVLITGGSDGLGKVTAQKLRSVGYEVTILGKDGTKTPDVAKGVDCKYVVADVTDDNAVRSAIKAVGEIDILINNAGVWLQGRFDENDSNRVRRTMDVNALGVMFVTQAVLPAMKQRGQGRIINIISQAGLGAKAERTPYNASKWAVTGFTKSLQQELKPLGLSVVGFYPGALNTEALFEKAGNPRDMSKGLSLDITADALAYICGLPDDVNVPEFGIESLNY
jgi:NAD(P)-dependent dehydrogenase (short-subunit alcohol dehydrogenase family)